MRGDCLNGLVSKSFPLSSASLKDPGANIPKEVKRVHEIFKNPTFMADLQPSDLKQGAVGNCWFIAAMSALAAAKDGISRLCVEYDTSESSSRSAPRAPKGVA